MHKAVLFNHQRKCLSCNTYHDLEIQNCPKCSGSLYICSSVFTPKSNKFVVTENENAVTTGS